MKRTCALAVVVASLAILLGHVASAGDPAGPTLRCAVERSTVTIAWDAFDRTPVKLTLARDGVVIATLEPGQLSYVDKEVSAGSHAYRLVAVFADETKAVRECGVKVGTSAVRCVVDGSAVVISWEVPAGMVARGFLITRDEELIATLPGEARSYRDEPPAGEHNYAVSTNNRMGELVFGGEEGPDYLIGQCAVKVGGVEDVLPPSHIVCGIAESLPLQVKLSWKNPVAYDSIVVTRGEKQIAVLDGVATSFSEPSPGRGRHVYGVKGLKGEKASRAATCVVEIEGPSDKNVLSFVPVLPGEGAGGDPPGGEEPPDPAGPASDAVSAVLTSVVPVQAWSFGVCSDPNVLEVDDAKIGAAAAALSPTFVAVTKLDSGVTMATVIDDQNPADVLPAGGPHELLQVSYKPGPAAVRGESYRVTFCGTLGDPPVAVLLVSQGLDVIPATVAGTVRFSPRPFRRGDVNNDEKFDLTDGIATLEWLFRGGTEPGCLDAADANGNGQVNIADPVYTFQRLFLGGNPPPAPFPDCGSGSFSLGCEESKCP